ncbi:hypothetical protein I4U23_020229 [Adineta vaga]|nr:hypothetical protein I4U23_020229 [Adineta vaga]
MDALNSHKSNDPYFRNKYIRQYLINADLINRRRNNVPRTSYEVILAERVKPKYIKARPSLNITNYVIEKIPQQRLYSCDEFVTNIQQFQKRKSRCSQQLSMSRNVTHIDVTLKSKSNQPLTSRSPKRSSERTKSAHRSPTNIKNQLERRSNTTKQLSNDDHSYVTMIYYGSQLNRDSNHDWYQSDGDEIVVMQQYSSGENLLVYKGFVKLNETFTFESRRHPNYPFALTLYINSYIDSRLSVCCEYKYKNNVRLYRNRGSFGIYDVQKVKPCQHCRFENQKNKKILSTSLNTTRSRNASTNTELNRRLSPPSKTNKKEPSQSRRSRAPKITQANKRSKPIDPRSLAYRSFRDKKDILSSNLQEDTSYTLDHQSLNGRKTRHEKSLQTSSTTWEETRPSSPTIPNEIKQYSHSSQSLLYTGYSSYPKSNVLEQSVVSSTYLSGNDDSHHSSKLTKQNQTSNDSLVRNISRRHQDKHTTTISFSSSNTSTSTSISDFDGENESTTAKQYTSSPSSSLFLSDEEQKSNSSEKEKSSNLVDKNKQNSRYLSTSSSQSSVDNSNHMTHSFQRRHLSASSTNTTTHNENFNLKSILSSKK